MGVHDVEDFAIEVIERSHSVPVVCDFWAEWCGPCRTLGPLIERLAEEADGRWVLAKLDTDAHPEIAQRYGIRGIPAVKLFVDGEVAGEFTGALPELEIRAWLDRVLPRSPHGELEQAQELLWEDPARALELIADIGPGDLEHERAEAIRTLATAFARLDDPESLAQVPVRTSYLAALAALRGRDFPTALDGLVSVIARDRAYDDDGARRLCLAIFHLLGEQDPVTRSYRAAFANAVYA